MADLGGEQGGVGGASPVTALVQIVGLVILLGGLYSASLVVSKGWALLEQPSEIRTVPMIRKRTACVFLK